MKPTLSLLSACIALSFAATMARADCPFPTIGSSYKWFARDDTSVELVLGRFTSLTQVSQDIERTTSDASGRFVTEKTTTIYDATLVGHSLGVFGFRNDFDENIKIVSQSYSPITSVGSGGGTPTLDRHGLVFLQNTPEGLLWSRQSCTKAVYYEPTARQLEQATQCRLGIWCPQDE